MLKINHIRKRQGTPAPTCPSLLETRSLKDTDTGRLPLLQSLIEDEVGEGLEYPVIHLSGPGIEIAFTNRKTGTDASIHSFVNGIETRGGSHVDALEKALVEAMDNIFYDVDICPSEILEGLSAAISINSEKLSPEGPGIHDFVRDFLSKELPLYFNAKPETKWQLMNHFSEIALWL